MANAYEIMMRRNHIKTYDDIQKAYEAGLITKDQRIGMIKAVGENERRNADIDFWKNTGKQVGKSLVGGAMMGAGMLIPQGTLGGAVFGAGEAIANNGDIKKEAAKGAVIGTVLPPALKAGGKVVSKIASKSPVVQKGLEKAGEVLSTDIGQIIKPKASTSNVPKQVLQPQKTNIPSIKDTNVIRSNGTLQYKNATSLNESPNTQPQKLPIAGEYDLTSIEGMKNIQDKGLRDLLTQGETETQTYYHGSPNPDIEVLDPEYNVRSLYGKGTYLANRSGEAVEQGMGDTLYTVETPHNQYLFNYDKQVGEQNNMIKYIADKLGLPENAYGGEVYDRLADRLGSAKAASKLLDDIGIKGHYVNFSDGSKYKVLYDKDSTKIVDKYTSLNPKNNLDVADFLFGGGNQ